jgi:transposase
VWTPCAAAHRPPTAFGRGLKNCLRFYRHACASRALSEGGRRSRRHLRELARCRFGRSPDECAAGNNKNTQYKPSVNPRRHDTKAEGKCRRGQREMVRSGKAAMGTIAPPCVQKARRAHPNARGSLAIFLPAYSPDLNPIEQLFARLKSFLRKTKARTVEELWRAIASFLKGVSKDECKAYLANSGYA